jgi:phage terminase small subunit
MQQRFVESLMTAPIQGQKNALRTAGYKGTDASCGSQALRWMKQPAIQDAIQEASRVYLRNMLPKAVNALDGVLGDPRHRDHHKAIIALLDRTGFHAMHESRQTVEHTVNDQVLIAKVRAMAEQLGIDATKLLPSLSPPAVDVEFIEVAETSE